MFHRLIRRWFFNSRYIIRPAFIHLEGGKGGKFAVRRWYFSLFLSPEKEARRVAETVSCSRFVLPPTWFRVLTSQESPMNLQPGPSQSIVKLPRLYRTTISASLPLTLLLSLPLPPRRSSPSAFLTKPFGIMESLAEGRIVPLNSRPCIFIFRCRMVEKKQEKSPACEFFHFSLRQPTFLLENFCISDKFYRISRMYHETWNKTARNM